MKLEATTTLSWPDPDKPGHTRDVKPGERCDDVPEDQLAMYLDRGFVKVVGAAAAKPDPEPEVAAEAAAPDPEPEPEPAPEPKPKATKKAAKKPAKKKTTRKKK